MTKLLSNLGKNLKSKVFGLGLVVLGFSLLFYLWMPIVEWNLFKKPQFVKKKQIFLSPVASEDFNNLKNDLNSGSSLTPEALVVEKPFYLTIEKLKIQNAKVVTGDDFYNQLAHYPKSVLPGEVGNVVISGHSVLPQFFQPANYLTIFSKLYLLEKGDKILVELNNRSFTYYVLELQVVGPYDTWVLEPATPYDSYLTLLTCGVGGFSQERIIILAQLANSKKTI